MRKLIEFISFVVFACAVLLLWANPDNRDVPDLVLWAVVLRGFAYVLESTELTLKFIRR